MPTCAACGVTLRSTQRFCTACGEPRPLDDVEDGDPGAGDRAHDPDATLVRSPREAPARSVAVAVDDEPTSDGTASPTEVITVTGGVDLSACPACDAVNAVERAQCARCGTSLRAGAEPVQGVEDWSTPAGPADDSSGDLPVAPPGRRPRTLGIAVVVVGALLGAVLAAWLFGFGPFQRTTGSGVEFRGADYPGQADAVRPDQAQTSPVRPAADGRTFGVAQAVDGDLSTAWIGTDGDGARMTFEFDRPMWVTAVEVANGDQSSDEAFEETARIRTLDVDLGFGERLRATLLSGTGWQVFRPLTPVLTDEITLVVVDRTEGEQVALAEVRFVGFPADADDARDFAEAA